VLDALAARLEEKEVISGEEVNEIIDSIESVNKQPEKTAI
jgi:hypothetical protein